MVFSYKTVLLIGATSGIGAALAEKLLEVGCQVIAVGRRQEKLDGFMKRHSADKAAVIKYDITDLAGMDAFVDSAMKQYPDIDCVFINAGIQFPLDLRMPQQSDLKNIHAEIDTNFTSVVNLTLKFLPRLLESGGPCSFLYTGSTLSWVPAPGIPIYSATKAALNSFVQCLRDQLRTTNVQVIELSPPLVQTELHDYMGVEKGRAFGMPLDTFTELAWNGLSEGRDEIIVGSPGPPPIDPDFLRTFTGVVRDRRTLFGYLSQLLRRDKASISSYSQFTKEA